MDIRTVDLDRVIADHGTIVSFGGTAKDGTPVVVDVDHRPARDIANGIERDGVAVVQPEAWQVRRLGFSTTSSSGPGGL